MLHSPGLAGAGGTCASAPIDERDATTKNIKMLVSELAEDCQPLPVE